MSRNGPIGYTGTRPSQRRSLPDDPFTAPPTGQGAPQWPPQHAQQPAYPQQPPHGQQQPAYAQPQQPHAPLPGFGQQAYGAQEGHGQQAAQRYFFPQNAGEPEPAPGYAPQAAGHQLPYESPVQAAPGYPPQPQHPQTAPRWSQQPDPRGYDLGNYMPTAAQGYAQPEPAPYQPALDPVAHQQHAELDPAALPRHNDAGRFDAPQHGYGENDADYDEILAEDEEEPRRGRRGMMIAAALVGAIGLGGALAYTYKTFVASSGSRAPVIKAADFGPNKVKPVVQDGKSFPNTDKKLLNRLGEDSSTPGRVGMPPPSAPDASDDRASDDPNAPRKVRIIPITPGAPPAGAAPMTTASTPPPRPSGSPPLVAVPGVTLENLGTPPPPSAARAVLPPPQAPAKAAPPVKMASAAKAEPPALPAADPAMAARKLAPPPAAKEAVAKTPVPKTKTAAVAPVAPAAAPTSATSGYVAVLSSKKSRMDALKTFADMQQKYGDVLASRTPDVQEVNLGDKGIWYRAVVGPPGSRDAAAGLCGKLKTAGYSGCWVTAY